MEKNYGGSYIHEAYSINLISDDEFIFIGSSSSNDRDVTNNIGSIDFWKLSNLVSISDLAEQTQFKLLPNPVPHEFNLQRQP